MNGNALFKWAFTIIPSCMFWFALQGNDAAVGRALVAYAVEIVLAAVAWTAVAVWSFYDDEFL
ncbi:hypothetical protein DFJ74DRAFT_693854 [Hyaloraphidium curvatum]|nr:hypothetical protein DFJ74DRAFT_693854 [Hyaloraphidium curvatum]